MSNWSTVMTAGNLRHILEAFPDDTPIFAENELLSPVREVEVRTVWYRPNDWLAWTDVQEPGNEEPPRTVLVVG